MDESEFFFRLTPDRVLEAVESGGFHPTRHCTALNALENRVYDVRVEAEGAQEGATPYRQLVAKFYRPGRWSREAIQDEHRILPPSPLQIRLVWPGPEEEGDSREGAVAD